MDGMCPNSSAYAPSSLVEAFHSIPHVDIDLNASPDSFDLTITYFQTVIIWACVPILVVVCLFILLAVYFICVCCCCCCQQHEKRSNLSRGCCGALVIILVLLSLGMVGVALWAEFELDQNIVQSFDAARNATFTVEDIQNTTVSYSYDESGAQVTLMDLRQGIRNQGGTGSSAEMSADELLIINRGLGTVISEIQAQAMPFNFGDLDAAFLTLDLFELARHWAVFAYLIVTAILLLLVALSVCLSACCRSPVCMVIMMVVFFFVTFVMWVAVGANLALLVVSGDICFAPDALIRNFTTSVSSMVTPELLDYYLICNQTCYPSPFQPMFDNATETFVTVATNEATIQTYIDGQTNPPASLQMDLNSTVTHFNGAEGFVDEVEGLANCELINTDYLSLLSNLCTDGYLFSVVLFAMACGIAVFMILILICGAFYAGLLSEGREYDDETVVYDFPNSGDGPTAWDSYGTQQHYTPYRDTYEMRNSPPPLGSDPPKYTDLSARHSNGAQFASDGTVGVTVGPASGEIDLGDPLNT